MHAAALHLVPILGAEKSKVPFYIAGGVLVAWALIVSLGLGLRMSDFPRTGAAQRVVIAISAVLVAVTASTAVITSGASTKANASGAAGGSSTQTSTDGEASTAPATSTPNTPPKVKTGTPKATTGTPPPPSSPAVGAGSSVLKLAANPGGQLSYEPKQLRAKAGNVTIDFTNMSPVEHNVTIAQGAAVLGTTPTFQSGEKTLTLSLKPGTYTFYCSVPGHRQAGMEGTLTVS